MDICSKYRNKTAGSRIKSHMDLLRYGFIMFYIEMILQFTSNVAEMSKLFRLASL